MVGCRAPGFAALCKHRQARHLLTSLHGKNDWYKNQSCFFFALCIGNRADRAQMQFDLEVGTRIWSIISMFFVHDVRGC